MPTPDLDAIVAAGRRAIAGAADLEAQLARFALLGRGLDVQAATIGASLGRAVVIEGRRGDPIAVHAPADLPAAAAAVATVPQSTSRWRTWASSWATTSASSSWTLERTRVS